jgi:hypothetical protein
MPRSIRPGVQRLQQGELLGDDQRRVIGEHHAAGADGDPVGHRGQVRDEHRRVGAGHGGGVVVLGDPDPPVPQPVGRLRHLHGVGQGVGGGLARADRGQLEDGQGQRGGNGLGHRRRQRRLPRAASRPGARRARSVASRSTGGQIAFVATKRWQDLSPRTRRFVVVAGVIEGSLKIAALIDLARRPASEVRGSKPRWAAALVLINSVGAVPIAYFARGRRRR